eukprot:TRINITY_DN175_c1_g1_i3.p1 TRINITY_DN175_c1_g1~~TRINITY_DN175_c1_g1_i3.p1  ORF type:complete len:189 (-),score=65.95 TRINITY_DN175_c1_g1_i3:280-846(-)
MQEVEKINEERLRAAREKDEIVESVLKVKVSTRNGKLTVLSLLEPKDDEPSDEVDTTRTAKEMALDMELRCLKKESEFLVSKLAEEKQRCLEDVQHEKQITEQTIEHMKELAASHMATLRKLDEANKERDTLKAVNAEQRQEIEKLKVHAHVNTHANAHARTSIYCSADVGRTCHTRRHSFLLVSCYL